MLNIILNISGIIIIFYSIITIKNEMKRVNKTKDTYEEVEHGFPEDKFEEFSEILERKEEEIDTEKNIEKNQDFNISLAKNMDNLESESDIEYVEYTGIIKDARGNSKINYSNNEILELKKKGYKNIDIARKTGRSIREIEVILKLYKE